MRRALAGTTTLRLDELELFGSIPSTNTHLLEQPPPQSGRFRVAIADHQTAGRGRHDRRWVSPPGSGLCLSLAYSFRQQPEHLPALTLALGVGIVGAMQGLHIHGIGLKWPNDIVALDGKLGGMLTEVQSSSRTGVTVISGIGLNLDLPDSLAIAAESDSALRPVDLKRVKSDHDAVEVIAAAIIDALFITMANFEEHGFMAFADAWARHDWLYGREITVDSSGRSILGVAAGVDVDGALFVDTTSERIRVISGSIITADLTEPGS